MYFRLLIYFLFPVYECFVYLYEYVPFVYLAPSQARRGCSIPWNWYYRFYESYHMEAQNKPRPQQKQWLPKQLSLFSSQEMLL